ncbi:MAG: carbohydrate kinase family protein [Phaeodactylibacter sp.]|nr:carbohydrate kinase family protein [Phaeodactylibacter sp.]
MNPKKIAILGPIPRDTIITYMGEEILNYGCITHPAVALARLGDPGIEVIPVAHVRQADEGPIKERLRSFGRMNMDFISSEEDRGDIIQLRYINQNQRQEKQLGLMNPILPEDVSDLLDCAAFVFLPISDYEISLDTLQYLKASSEGQIIFDAHGPTNGVAINGQRFHKFWVDMHIWLPFIDVLKMNLEESKCCLVQPEYELSELESEKKLDTEHLDELGEYCLNLGLKALVITVDADGCVVFTKNAEGGVHKEIVPSIRMEHVIDTTGCGDTFAGGLAYGLLKYPEQYARAAQYANALAAMRTQGRTFDVFPPLADIDQMIQNWYP